MPSLRAAERAGPGQEALMDYQDETLSGRTAPKQLRGTGASDDSLAPSTTTGDLFARAGDWSQALSVFQQLWLERDPLSDPVAGLALARRIADCHEHLGRYQEAIRLLAPLLSPPAQPDALDPEERQELGRCRHVLGKCYFGSGQMAQAEAEARQAANLLGDAETPEPGHVQISFPESPSVAGT